MEENGFCVLLADDDDSLRKATAMMLREAGHDCIEAGDGAEAVRLFEESRPDLCILDVMMPRMDGFEACERIRKADPLVPILIISAKGDLVDKRVGYSLGADDYLVKPFGMAELLLKVGALRRRSALEAQKAPLPELRYVSVGNLRIDTLQHGVTVGGRKADLTSKEAGIMVALAARAGETLSKEELVESVWGSDYANTPINIPVYIRRLRNKLEENPNEPRYIQTVWGAGYRLSDSQ